MSKMQLAPTEQQMWKTSPDKRISSMSYREIERKYESGEQRILTELNREKLPSFVTALKTPKYMDLQPFYQRRSRWDETKQSKLIESFLINIPVPPIVLYERTYNSYEVMDGQQRITAIKQFYENQLVLTGLELWPELNGLRYSDLPRNIQAGIDRRSISSIVIITESTSDPEKALFLKQQTFERLNTGGVDLTNQEVRNCLYQGKFNDLLLELARHPIFVRAWKLPPETPSPHKVSKNSLYDKMEDVELVLRFFALQHDSHFRGGMKEFLDLYMRKSFQFSEEDINILRNRFFSTIELADAIYGEHLFKPFNPEKKNWKTQSYKAYYDAVMVGLSRHLEDAILLTARKSQVIEETKKLFEKPESRLLTGQGKTKADIQERIRLIEEMLVQVIASK